MFVKVETFELALLRNTQRPGRFNSVHENHRYNEDPNANRGIAELAILVNGKCFRPIGCRNGVR